MPCKNAVFSLLFRQIFRCFFTRFPHRIYLFFRLFFCLIFYDFLADFPLFSWTFSWVSGLHFYHISDSEIHSLFHLICSFRCKIRCLKMLFSAHGFTFFRPCQLPLFNLFSARFRTAKTNVIWIKMNIFLYFYLHNL